MKATVDFLMITEMNQILKNKNIDYSLHAVGGCSCCGLQLRCHGEAYDIDDILNIVNEYLATKWLVASYQDYDKTMFYINSKFEKK